MKPLWGGEPTPRLHQGDVVLRPPRLTDAQSWFAVRGANQEWLEPWDATIPKEGNPNQEFPQTFPAMVRRLRTESSAGRMMAWIIEYRRVIVGQVTMGGIAYGSLRSAYIGYWIDERFSRRGIMSLSVAMVADFAFRTLRLHRLELNIRPENAASRAVAEKVGFRLEGFRERYLHIDGDWRDHVSYTMFDEFDIGGAVERLKNRVMSGATNDTRQA